MMDETASETGSACSRGSGSDSGDDHASVAEQAQKRRLVIIAAVAAAFVYVVSRHISKRQKKKAVRLSCLRVQTNVFDWKLHIGEITEDDFRLMYRLTWDAFKKLLALLSPQTNAGADGPDARFERQVRRAHLARNQARHHAALPRGRFHPRPQHALQEIKTSNSTIYKWIWLTVSAINSHPELQVNFPLPNKVPGKDADADEYNAEQLRRLVELESEFRSNSKTPKADECWHGQVPPCAINLLSLCTTLLPGVVTLTPAPFRVCPFQVGALDGVIFMMKKPPSMDRRGNHVNQNAYFVSRKDKSASSASLSATTKVVNRLGS